MKSAATTHSRPLHGRQGVLVLGVLATMATLSGCALIDATDGSDGTHNAGAGTEMEFPNLATFNRSDYPDDPVDVVSAEIVGDSLDVVVRFSGGCEAHELRLIATNYWLESYPVQLFSEIVHEDPGDPCDAIVEERARFGLAGLRQSYFESYAPPGDVIIRVYDSDGDRATARYQFQ